VDLRSRLPALLLAAVLTIHAAAPLWASDAPQLPTQKTDPQIKALIVTLEDDDQRSRLVEDLRVLLNAANAATAKDALKQTGLLDSLSQRVGQISQNIVVAASAFLNAPAILSWLRDTFGDPTRRNDLFGIIAHIVGFLAAGLIVEAALRMALRGPRGRVEARADDGLGVTLVFLLARTILDLAPIVGFAAAAYGAVALMDPGAAVRLGALALNQRQRVGTCYYRRGADGRGPAGGVAPHFTD